MCKAAAAEQFLTDGKALGTDSELAAIFGIKYGVVNPIIRQFLLTATESTLNTLSERILKLELS